MRKYIIPFILLLLVFVVFGTVALAIFAYRYAGRELGYGFMDPYIYETQPAIPGPGRAMFITQGMQDRGISLYIDDPDAKQRFIYVGAIDWTIGGFSTAYWSNDGTLLACMNTYTQKPYYTYAYDFQRHLVLYPPGASSSSMRLDTSEEDRQKHSKMIEDLLSERGGICKSSLEREIIYNQNRKPPLNEWEDILKKYIAL